MKNVIWKAYKLGNLFELTSSGTIALKNYTLFDDYNEKRVEVVTSSKDNNNQFLDLDDLPKNIPVFSNALTINRNGSIGYCFYHNDKFIIPTGDSYVLTCLNERFKKYADESSYHFLSILITHIFTSDVFGWSYKVNDERFTREIIMLPCLEVAEGEDYIWEENGKHYTLAVEYIKKLMDQAKELREQKTIRLYEAERAKYEAERAKYEAGYEREKSLLVWKGFTLADLYNFDTSLQYPFTQKDLDISAEKSDYYNLAVIAQSAQNNGVIGYINKERVDNKYIHNHLMTFSLNFGICFYHDYDFALLDTHGSIFKLISKNEKFDEIIYNEKLVNLFLAKIIDKVCAKSVYNWNWKPNSGRVSREIIMLPCLEVAEGEDYIWEENGKHYTLAVEYISYIYLSGRVNKNQKLIDTYSYQY